MEKQANTPSLKASKRAAKAPSAAVVTKATPQGAMAAVAQVLAKAPTPAAKPAQEPAPGAPATPGLHGGIPLAQLPKNIAVRGAGVGKVPQGAGGITCKLGSKAPKLTAAHCQAWWASVQATISKHKGQATMAQLMEAQAPGHFVTYAVRNGWLAKV